MKFRPVKRADMEKFVAERRDEEMRLRHGSLNGPNLLVRLGARVQLWAALRLTSNLEEVMTSEDEEDRRDRHPKDIPGPWA